MRVLDISEWPKELKHYLVKGVFVGGCVKTKSRFRALAHAHCHPGEHSGWICILSEKRLTEKHLLLHELAHLISGTGHTDKWRKVLLSIGGTLDAVGSLRSYHKRTRINNKTCVICGKLNGLYLPLETKKLGFDSPYIHGFCIGKKS
jgi:hypothetical protein